MFSSRATRATAASRTAAARAQRHARWVTAPAADRQARGSLGDRWSWDSTSSSASASSADRNSRLSEGACDRLARAQAACQPSARNGRKPRAASAKPPREAQLFSWGSRSQLEIVHERSDGAASVTLNVDGSLQAVVERNAVPGLGVRETFAVTRKSDPNDDSAGDEIVLRTEWLTAGDEIPGAAATRERTHTAGSTAAACALLDESAVRAGADAGALLAALQGAQADLGSGGRSEDDGLLACAVTNLANLVLHPSPDEMRRSSISRVSQSAMGF